jgi:ribosomal protein L31
VWQFAEGTNVARMTSGGVMECKGLGLMDATGDLLSIVAASETTAHTLTMPAAQGAANAILQNDGSGNLAWTDTPTLAGADLSSGLVIYDLITFTTSGGGDGVIDFSGFTLSGGTITIPNGSGELVLPNSTVTLQNKTLQTNCKIRCGASGLLFQDATSTTKQARLDLSGITAGTTRAVKLIDTAGRVERFRQKYGKATA